MKRGSREDFFEEHDLAPEKQHLTDASLSRTSSTSILFCGNSFTTRNSVPETIEDMCKQRGLPVSVSVMAKGGASLKQHWNAEPFNDGASYDMVVLQEQSTLPVKNKDRFFANVKLFAGSDKIKQLILFGTWARSDTREHGKLISDAYSHIAAECGCKCALVGDVFMAVGEKISLYDKDKVRNYIIMQRFFC